MVEFILAAVLLAAVLLGMTVAMQQVIKSRNKARGRIDAYIRADAALRMLRRDLASVLRREDLYYTRVLLEDQAIEQDRMSLDRDEILVFNNRLQATRDIEYNGDGLEFETQYRIESDDFGPALWQRRDAMPDAYPRGGGIVSPVVEGLISLQIEAWNGINWFDQWDSDEEGLPWALRITVTATGAAIGQSPTEHPLAILRTVVPIDRSRMPLEVADARLAEDIMDRFGLGQDQYDTIVEAIASGNPPPIPRTTGGAPGAGLDAGTGGAAAGSSGGGSTTIDTPAGKVTIPGDGSTPTFNGGTGGSGGRQ
ncbi:MAG: hypothetical protein GY894_04130 [Planctomycetes bacterium]|nr:hypothetical protein [Planctomycetota bacterium]